MAGLSPKSMLDPVPVARGRTGNRVTERPVKQRLALKHRVPVATSVALGALVAPSLMAVALPDSLPEGTLLRIGLDGNLNGVKADGSVLAGRPRPSGSMKVEYAPGRTGQALVSDKGTANVLYPIADFANLSSGSVEFFFQDDGASGGRSVVALDRYDPNSLQWWGKLQLPIGYERKERGVALNARLTQSNMVVWRDSRADAFEMPGYEDLYGYGETEWRPGQWHQGVFAWLGPFHRFYLDGKPASGWERMRSGFLPQWKQALMLCVGNVIEWAAEHRTLVDDVSLYGFAFEPADAAAALAGVSGIPRAPAKRNPLHAIAEWAPGEQLVGVLADITGFGADAPTSVTVEALGPNQRRLGRATMTRFVGGLSYARVPLPRLGGGEYTIRVSATKQGGRETVTFATAPLSFKRPEWLYNDLGLKTPGEVLPPWPPIEVKSNLVACFGRVYTIGADGFPSSIVSLEKGLLSKPVTLKGIVGGQPLKWEVRTPARFTVVSKAVAEWTSQMEAVKNLRATVSAHFEYDGLLLYRITLVPNRKAGAPPLSLDNLAVCVSLRTERARLLQASADSNPWSSCMELPDKNGVLWDSTKLWPAQVRFFFVPYVWVGDYDRGLMWFAESDRNWIHDESGAPLQVLRTNDGVEIRANLVAQPATLENATTFEFGLQATPLKPQPKGWRAWRITQMYRKPNAATPVNLAWCWCNDKAFTGGLPNGRSAEHPFQPFPDSYDQWNKHVEKAYPGWNVAPFTNARMIEGDPDAAEFRSERKRIPYFWLYDDQTRSFQDFYLWKINKWMKRGGLRAIYLDEGYPQASFNLVNGTAYFRPDGSVQGGYSLLRQRQFYRRLRSLFLENKLQPMIWLHTSYRMPSYALAFGDITMDGELFDAASGVNHDFVNTIPLPYIASFAMGRQYGFVPHWQPQENPKLWQDPKLEKEERPKVMRSASAILLLHDVSYHGSPESVSTDSVKDRFEIGTPDVRFCGYWDEEGPVQSLTENVYVSSYIGNKKALLIVSNLGEQDSSVRLQLDWRKLGLPPDSKIVDGQSLEQWLAHKGELAVYEVEEGALLAHVPRHDYRMILMWPQEKWKEIEAKRILKDVR